jgi:hypothetical protein
MSINYKQLLADLEQRGMPVAEFAVVLAANGIRFASKTRLNEAFRETNPIPLRDDIAEKVWHLWQEIEAMAIEVYTTSPYAVMNLADGARVHTSLQIFRALQAGLELMKGSNSSEITIHASGNDNPMVAAESNPSNE